MVVANDTHGTVNLILFSINLEDPCWRTAAAAHKRQQQSAAAGRCYQAGIRGFIVPWQSGLAHITWL